LLKFLRPSLRKKDSVAGTAELNKLPIGESYKKSSS